MPKECIKGTVVYIYSADVDGEPVWKGTANDNGVFDTGCRLKCTATYKVVPKNAKCKFFPEYKDVRVPCCPKFVTVEFRCKCETENKGRIDIILTENCIKGTKINILDANEKVVKVLEKHNEGVYSTGCTLPCPGTYYVKPLNSNCKFSPEIQKVIMKECCPKFTRVTFKCVCRKKNIFTRGIMFFTHLTNFIMNYIW